MKTFFKKIYIITLLLVCLAPSVSFAADVSISIPKAVRVGENFDVLINLDSDGEVINSADMVLDYDQKLMSFSGYKTDDTMMRIWIDSPRESDGKIFMAGIIPGGVSGIYDPRNVGQKEPSTIPIVRLTFTSKATGNAQFSFSKTEFLKNDGAGTPLIHNSIGGNIEITNASGQSGDQDIPDKGKPEPFEIIFLKASPDSETPNMLIFEARDTGSGIKEYKISAGGSMWQEVESPHQINKGLFAQTIIIRAFDFYGNFQDSSIRVDGLLPAEILWLLLVLLIVFCILGYRMLKYRK